MTPKAIMIFAAGRGTRMGDLTKDRPKPLIEVAGRPLIDHALDLTEGRGLRRVVNLHHHAPMLRRHLADRAVALSDETGGLLETGGGLRHALPLLGAGPVFTLNSDAVWTGANPLDALARGWDAGRMDALLLLVRRADAIGHQGRGDFVPGTDGALLRGPGLVYTGAQIVDPALLGTIPDRAFSLNRLWDLQLERGRLYGVVHQGKWCDVGHPQGIALAEDMLEGRNV